MAPSTTVWAAVLFLASFSGSGPLLTTAEAMPAPGPQETQARPRYYFPRQVKRQIMTNTTVPAAPTIPPASSSSIEQLESRQPDILTSLLEVIDPKADESIKLDAGKTNTDVQTGTVTSIQIIQVTPVPELNNPLPGTGNQSPSPALVSPGPVEERPSSNVVPSIVLRPAASPQADPNPEPLAPSSTARVPSPGLALASTGLIPEVIVPATSATPTPPARPSSSAPAAVLQPSPASPASVPAGNVPSSLLAPTVAPTGSAPATFVQPSPIPVAPVSPGESGQRVGSTGPVPEVIIPASSALAAPPQPSAPVVSSFLGPFLVPGSTGAGIPSSVVQPTQSQGLVGGLQSTLVGGPGATLTSDIGSTGVLPSSIALPTLASALPSTQQPLLVQSSSGGIVVGITTALGTGALTPTSMGDDASPTSKAVLPSGSLVLSSRLSSLTSEVPGVLPPGSAGPTAPVSQSPVPSVSAALPSAVSGLPVSVTSSILSTLVSDLPTSATIPVVHPSASNMVSSIASDISSGLISSGSIPSGVPTLSGAVRTSSDSILASLSPSETPTASPSAVSSGLLSTSNGTPSGILPSGVSGTGISSAPTVTPSPTQSSGVPASESTFSPAAPSSASAPLPSSGNVTISETPTFVIPSSSVPASDSSTAVAPSPTPIVTSKPTPVQSQRPTGSDNATTMVVGSSIIQETTSNATPTATSSGIPSSLPKMIAPPGGFVGSPSGDDFLGQVCFKWPLNYPFVSANDGGNQIFHYLPKAVADGLNISVSDVRNVGLRPLDTTAYQGFITTLALFTIPKDLENKLAAQLRNPADPFWRNKDQSVNDLTDLINTACPLPAGKLPGDNGIPNQAANPAATAPGGPGDGGALGGDINSSRPVNASAAGIATGAIVGAIAYGAAMFFVARRYRNKRIAHERSSSVPSTGSRMTFGSIPGGAAAWMHGARNGRITPASRGSQGSSSTQGHSVRTQQISAPVMAENSLGWD